MTAFATPHDWFYQFMAGGVLSNIEVGILDDETIVNDWCASLNHHELSQLLQGIREVMYDVESHWGKMREFRHFNNADEARQWLARIHQLIQVKTE